MKNTSKVGLIVTFFLLATACANPTEKPSQVDKPLVESQYRLQEDRKAFEELRAQIPKDTQQENDEVAFMDKLFENPLKNPSDIRAQFSKALSKRRERFQKDMQKLRELFVRKERKDREQTTKNFEKERKEFKLRKSDRDQTKDFFAALDQKRKDFYTDQKEKRDEFEAQMRDDRNNFEDYARDKQNEFNAKLKDFTEKQKELKKEKKSGSP